MDPNLALASVVMMFVFGGIAVVAMCLRMSFNGRVNQQSMDVKVDPPEKQDKAA